MYYRKVAEKDISRNGQDVLFFIMINLRNAKKHNEKVTYDYLTFNVVNGMVLKGWNRHMDLLYQNQYVINIIRKILPAAC